MRGPEVNHDETASHKAPSSAPRSESALSRGTRSACHLPCRGGIRHASIPFGLAQDRLLAMLAGSVRQRKKVCHAQVNYLSVHHHAQTTGLGVARCRQDGGVTDGRLLSHTLNAYRHPACTTTRQLRYLTARADAEGRRGPGTGGAPLPPVTRQSPPLGFHEGCRYNDAPPVSEASRHGIPVRR
jgi:hypothetical protein